jgi:hypothetical protein
MMEYKLLFRKARTVKEYRVDYLDETSEFSHQVKARRSKSERDYDHEEICGEIKKNLDYFTKEETFGNIYAGGFIRENIVKSIGSAPENLDKDTIKNMISKEIKSHSDKNGSYRGAFGHHCIISMSKDLMSEIEDNGGNIDYYLSKAMKRSLLNFQKEFHPGQKIGYAFGIHHDTAHRHVHIFIHNRTEKPDGSKGDHVAMSNPLKGRVDSKPRLDQIGFVKEQMEIQAKWIIADLKRNNQLKQTHNIKSAISNEVHKFQFDIVRKVEESLNKSQARVYELNKEKFEMKQRYNDVVTKVLGQSKISQKKIDELISIAHDIKKVRETTNTLGKFSGMIASSPSNRMLLKMSRTFTDSRQKEVSQQISSLIDQNKERILFLKKFKEAYMMEVNRINLEKNLTYQKIESEKRRHQKAVDVLPLLQEAAQKSPSTLMIAQQNYKHHQDLDILESYLKMRGRSSKKNKSYQDLSINKTHEVNKTREVNKPESIQTVFKKRLRL